MSKSAKTPKVTKTVPPPAEAAPAPKTLGEAAKERAARKASIAQKDLFVFVKVNEKPIAPQAKAILNTIQAHPEGVLRPALVEALKPVLVTRQPAERILTYYQKALVEAGVIEIVNPERNAETASAPAEATGDATAE